SLRNLDAATLVEHMPGQGKRILGPSSTLLEEFRFHRNQITLPILEQHLLDPDDTLNVAFNNIHHQRVRRGLIPYYSGKVYRPIGSPRVSAIGMEIDVAPINYTYSVTLSDEAEPPIRQHANELIDAFAERVAMAVRTDHPYFNWWNSHTL